MRRRGHRGSARADPCSARKKRGSANADPGFPARKGGPQARTPVRRGKKAAFIRTRVRVQPRSSSRRHAATAWATRAWSARRG
ncbi:MAG: hypothetical protein ACK559_25270, partial [bacterium]